MPMGLMVGRLLTTWTETAPVAAEVGRAVALAMAMIVAGGPKTQVTVERQLIPDSLFGTLGMGAN